MSGAGNDFVIVDNRSGHIKDGPKLARIICDRRAGVGADGLLLIEPSTVASYRMMYYNADGSYGGMCGNGGRCLAQFAVMNKLAQPNHSFEALDFLYEASVENGQVTLSMKDPKNIKLDIVLPVGSQKLKMHFVDTGSPHVVIPIGQFRKGLQAIDVMTLGRQVRSHKKFRPLGANVNFIDKTGTNTLKIRTYERGVEDETLACGTGSIASAVIGHKIWNIRPPVRILPRSGIPLEVNFELRNGRYERITLRGPAVVTFAGTTDV